MATYKIIHREELIGEFLVEADSEEEALAEYEYQVNEGQIDFSDLEIVNSSNVAFFDKDS